MSRISRQKSCPSLILADSRRSETVSTSAPDARAASDRIAGEGYCDVPSRSREARFTPYRARPGKWVTDFSSAGKTLGMRAILLSALPRRDDLDPVARL